MAQNQIGLTVVIPVFNNASTVGTLLADLSRHLPNVTDSFEVLAIDDGSTDESWQIIQHHCSLNRQIRGLKLSRNFGQHQAIRAGLKNASGKWLVLMDADLADNPVDIKKLLDVAISGNFDIAVSTWDHEKYRQRYSSRIFHQMVGRLTKSANHIVQQGTFRVFNRSVCDALLQYSEQRPVYGPLMDQIGFRKTYVMLDRQKEHTSKSSYSMRKRLALAVPLLASYSNVPFTLAVSTGFGILLCCAAVCAALLIRFVNEGGNPFSTTVLFAFTGFVLIGSLFILLGAVLFYLLIIFRETLDRPGFHIENDTSYDAS